MFFGAGTELFVEPRELSFSPYISRDKLSLGTAVATQFMLLEKVYPGDVEQARMETLG